MTNKIRCALMVGFFAVSMSGFAVTTTVENRAVKIDIGSIGGKLDTSALRAVRQVVGYGIASGTVDNFTVFSPKTGSVPIEGGLSACADAGFTASKGRFGAFIQDLKAIKPRAGTFYTVVPAPSCVAAEPVFCTMDVQSCPDGSFVSRAAPSCAFAPCPSSK